MGARRQSTRDDVKSLVDGIAPRLYRYGVVRLGSHLLAEEAVSETLCRLVTKGPALDGPPAHVRGWSVRCMVNVCREFERRRPVAMSIDVAGDRSLLPKVRFEPAIRDEVERDLLHTTLRSLPDRQREAVTLRILMNMTVAESAEAMGCAEGTVRALTHQGLASMRSTLDGQLELAG